MFFRGQTIGKYRILSSLGSGGFGTVYLAEDTLIDKKVALKVPHKQNLDFSEMLKEPRLLASMSHPNIVSVLTAEKQDDVFFIVMEYVPGETLEHLIMREGVLDLTRGARLQLPDLQRRRPRARRRHPAPRPAARQHARLRKRHAEGHRLRHVAIPRDRRARHDGDRQPAVHGARTVSRQGRVRQRHLLGRRDDVSDAHRLDAVRHARRRRDIARLARGELVSAPRIKNPKIPKAINDIVLRAMAPEPTDRYQTAAELLEALLAAREPAPRRAVGRGGTATAEATVAEIQSRLKARETPPARFCWHCRKPLHARTDRCPFCNEAQ